MNSFLENSDSDSKHNSSSSALTETIYALVREGNYPKVNVCHYHCIQAIEILSHLLASGRKDRSVYSVLGFCHYQAGDFARAQECYQALVKICPDVVDYAYYLAQCLAKTGRYEEAIAVCEEKLDRSHL